MQKVFLAITLALVAFASADVSHLSSSYLPPSSGISYSSGGPHGGSYSSGGSLGSAYSSGDSLGGSYSSGGSLGSAYSLDGSLGTSYSSDGALGGSYSAGGSLGGSYSSGGAAGGGGSSYSEPSNVYLPPASAPVYSAPAPAPVYSAPAPAPVYSAPASAPVYSAPVYSAPAALTYQADLAIQAGVLPMVRQQQKDYVEFSGCTFRPGWLSINCEDAETLECLPKITPTFKPWKDAEIARDVPICSVYIGLLP
ncbi:PREDICTED: translation initiation factor IF-2-like [Rhagoletis zephyria]|uniref:translation initiation factor IF-2-like n=1 Tax=Rhagoletis zephyria TaxID=28612 RepID=UPI0008113F74|nr:PREDICTED: translation initiation factor IF-2-like [Rhagoletis zephyria]